MREPAYADRRRAGVFGSAADDYDRFRPRYPDHLIAGLVVRPGMRVLDVGAGTGIASRQLRDAGADLLAVEPDPRMARVAKAHDILVEEATFEDWDPGGRTFDLVVFAQSFHWVRPEPALDKVASILRPGGRLAVLANRIVPHSPTQDHLDKAYVGYLDKSQRPSIVGSHGDDLTAMIRSRGYSVEKRYVIERLHYPRHAWVNLVCTYSNVLTLEPAARAGLRAALHQRISTEGVDAENQAVAVVATPIPKPEISNGR